MAQSDCLLFYSHLLNIWTHHWAVLNLNYSIYEMGRLCAFSLPCPLWCWWREGRNKSALVAEKSCGLLHDRTRVPAEPKCKITLLRNSEKKKKTSGLGNLKEAITFLTKAISSNNWSRGVSSPCSNPPTNSSPLRNNQLRCFSPSTSAMSIFTFGQNRKGSLLNTPLNSSFSLPSPDIPAKSIEFLT